MRTPIRPRLADRAGSLPLWSKYQEFADSQSFVLNSRLVTVLVPRSSSSTTQGLLTRKLKSVSDPIKRCQPVGDLEALVALFDFVNEFPLARRRVGDGGRSFPPCDNGTHERKEAEPDRITDVGLEVFSNKRPDRFDGGCPLMLEPRTDLDFGS